MPTQEASHTVSVRLKINEKVSQGTQGLRKDRKVVSVFLTAIAPALPTGQACCRQAGFLEIIAIQVFQIVSLPNLPAGRQVVKLPNCICDIYHTYFLTFHNGGRHHVAVTLQYTSKKDNYGNN